MKSHFMNKSRDIIRILFFVNLFIQIGSINFLEKSVKRAINKSADLDDKTLSKNIDSFEIPGILSETPTIIKQSGETSISSSNNASDLVERPERNPQNSILNETNLYERPIYYSSVIEDHPVAVMGGTNGSKGLVTLDLLSINEDTRRNLNVELNPAITVNSMNGQMHAIKPPPSHAQQVDPNDIMAHDLNQFKNISPQASEMNQFQSISSQDRSNEPQKNLVQNVDNHRLNLNPGSSVAMAYNTGEVSSTLNQIQYGQQAHTSEFVLHPAIPENSKLLMQHHILKIPDFIFSIQKTTNEKEENILNAINQNSSILLDLNQKSFKKMKKFMKQTKFILESFKEELLEENMDSPLKHQVEIENEFESIIQNEDIMQNVYLSDLPINYMEAHNKFIIDSESIKTFFEKEN